MHCTLCERDFTDEQIDKGIPIPSGSTQIWVTIDGIFHTFNFSHEKKVVRQMAGRGVYLSPAPPTPSASTDEPQERIAPPIKPESWQPSAATQADQLSQRWKQSGRVSETTPAEVEPYNAYLIPETGEVVEAFVVAWNLHDPTGLNRGGCGFARPTTHAIKIRNGLFFKESSIITQGADTIRVGSRIRGEVTKGTRSEFDLINVEIFREN